jgi:hypothetical protein
MKRILIILTGAGALLAITFGMIVLFGGPRGEAAPVETAQPIETAAPMATAAPLDTTEPEATPRQPLIFTLDSKIYDDPWIDFPGGDAYIQRFYPDLILTESTGSSVFGQLYDNHALAEPFTEIDPAELFGNAEWTDAIWKMVKTEYERDYYAKDVGYRGFSYDTSYYVIFKEEWPIDDHRVYRDCITIRYITGYSEEAGVTGGRLWTPDEIEASIRTFRLLGETLPSDVEPIPPLPIPVDFESGEHWKDAYRYFQWLGQKPSEISGRYAEFETAGSGTGSFLYWDAAEEVYYGFPTHELINGEWVEAGAQNWTDISRCTSLAADFTRMFPGLADKAYISDIITAFDMDFELLLYGDFMGYYAAAILGSDGREYVVRIAGDNDIASRGYRQVHLFLRSQ